MAVPAHDQRDFEFAQVFQLPIVRAIAAEGDVAEPPVTEAYDGPGYLVNSGQFDRLEVTAAKSAITKWLAQRGAGEARVEFRLHDWCISRQRYWGPPIPMIYCDNCGIVPVPESDLPVLLPLIDDFRPDASGVAPLARIREFYEVTCPECGKPGRRETDVSDTFLDSAWYFLRYPSTDRDDTPMDPHLTRKWLPVDMYIGGNEHAVLHLMYTRFITMALHDLGLLEFEEPFKKFRAHGLIIKDGAKMSKSRGNVVNPDRYLDQYGADIFRMYMMFLGPYEEGGDFRDEGITGVQRFLETIWRLVREQDPAAVAPDALLRATHRTIKKVQEDIEALRYNTAIAALMSLLNDIRRQGPPSRWVLESLLIMVAPFAPHITEELWEALDGTSSALQPSGSIFDTRWPIFDQAMTVDETVELVIQVNGKVRGRIAVSRDAGEDSIIARALTEPSVRAHIDGKTIRKQLVVPGHLVSLVV